LIEVLVFFPVLSQNFEFLSQYFKGPIIQDRISFAIFVMGVLMPIFIIKSFIVGRLLMEQQ
jgi:hypothetical protein